MKVYIVTPEQFPYGMAATNRVICYAKALLYVGVKCEVVIYHRTEVYGCIPQNTIGEGVYESIPFRYIGGTPLRGCNVFIRRFNDWKDKRNTISYLHSKLKRNDVILFYCGGDVDFSLKLVKVARGKNAFMVRDVCELPYGTGRETQKSIRNRKITLEKQFPQLDGFVCISEHLLNLAKSYGSKKTKYVKVPILVDFDKYYLEDKSLEAEIPYIFHSGTLFEQKDGILGIIEAFGKAVKQIDHPVRFILTGNLSKSPHKQEIERLIQQYDLKDLMVFTGYLSTEDLKIYLSRASLVIINKYRTQQNHYCFSTKLGEYLAAAKPVIITDVGEAMTYLENNKSAIVVPHKDNDALADAIVSAFNDISRLKCIGMAGQQVCLDNFDYRIQGKVLKNFVTSLQKDLLWQ